MSEVTIVGGGLAGIASALRLLQRGYHVTLYEASGRLGGKAGADYADGDWDEHGFHLFPMWYLNLWRLVDELGIVGNFIDRLDVVPMWAGQFPHFKTLRGISSRRYFRENLWSGVLSLPQMFLFFYCLWDLAGQPHARSGRLDQTSLLGFFRSRWYSTSDREVIDLLNAITVAGYNVSSMTVRNVVRHWLKYSAPVFRILRGNIQECLILPLQHELERLGCCIHLGSRLTRLVAEGSRIRRLEFIDQANHRTFCQEVERLILAVPQPNAAALLEHDLMHAAPSLSRIHRLRSQPMAALNIYLKTKIPGLPSTFVMLVDSKYGIYFIDVSQTWQGYEGTVLNVAVADHESLAALPAERAIQVLLEEIKRFVPGLDGPAIRKTVWLPHADSPLFVNDLGAWEFRPGARTEITNMYLAGDYCRNFADHACMEGAVTAGLLAADAVRKDSGCPNAVEILRPEAYPRWLFSLSTFAGLPFAALAKIAGSRRRGTCTA